MAKIRYAVLENDKALTSTQVTGTETIDLPETGILSNVTVQGRYTGSYSDNQVLPMMHAITKLEVLVDGSTVIKSLSGPEARALCWYNKGPWSLVNDYLNQASANLLYHVFPLYFGTSNTDTKHGLDLGQYSNPQAKITYDFSQTSVEGVTYDATSTPTFTYNVMAKVIDGTPTGFTNTYVQSREIDNWTVAASTEHRVEIPRGHDLYGLMLRSGYKALGFDATFEHTKLDFDNGKWVPIDLDYENLAVLHKEAWPDPVIYNTYASLANGDDFDSQMMYVVGGGAYSVGGNMSSPKLPIIYYPINVVTIPDYTGTAITSQSQFQSTQIGWGPNQTFYLPMSKLLDGDVDVVKTTDYGRIDLKITTGSGSGSSAKTQVVAEYLKPNGM